jgi:hypothetical protein
MPTAIADAHASLRKLKLFIVSLVLLPVTAGDVSAAASHGPWRSDVGTGGSVAPRRPGAGGSGLKFPILSRRSGWSRLAPYAFCFHSFEDWQFGEFAGFLNIDKIALLVLLDRKN